MFRIYFLIYVVYGPGSCHGPDIIRGPFEIDDNIVRVNTIEKTVVSFMREIPETTLNGL